MCFVIFSLNQGLICSLSNGGDKVSMCHFKEIYLGLTKIISWILVGIGGPKIVLKWTQMVPNGPKMVLAPIPIPGVSKSLVPEGKTIRKKQKKEMTF